MKLFLDDIRKADWVYPDEDCWVTIRDPKEFLRLVRENAEKVKAGTAPEIDEVSLDHDLGLDIMSGMDVLNELERMAFAELLYVPYIRVHTANFSVRALMERVARDISERCSAP